MGVSNAGLYGAEGLLGTNGAPAVSTAVTVYATGTEDAVTLYTDETMTTEASNPVSTDANGNLSFWCQPQVVDLSFSFGGDPTTLTVEVYPYGVDSSIPTGTILPFLSDTIPPGWLLCDGSAVSRTTYATLFGIIAETFGAGDGSTTFNIPDMRSRVIVGASSTAPDDTDQNGATLSQRVLGHTAGEENHLLVAGEGTIETHNHGVSDTGHTHTVFGAEGTGQAVSTPYTGGGQTSVADFANSNTSSNETGIAIQNAGPTNATTAHNNMQPYIAVYHILKY